MEITRKLFGTVLTAFFIYLAISMFAVYASKNSNLETFLTINLGGIFLSEAVDDMTKINLLELFRIVVPLGCFVYIVSKFVADDFVISAVYVFTRNASVAKWYFKRLADLLIISFVYSFTAVSVTCVVGLASGKKIDTYIDFISISVHILLLFTLTLFVYALIINIVSIRITPIIGYAVSYTMLIVSILLPMVTLGASRKFSTVLFPTCQYMIGFHDYNIIRKLDSGIIVINGFKIGFSYMYLIFVSLVIGVIGFRLIKKMDIINFDW